MTTTTELETHPRVLIAEDERELAELLRRLLVGEGFDVDLVFDGQAALHAGLTRQFDVLLFDRRLPAIDGLEVLARLRRQGVVVPTAMLTALGTVPDRVEGLEAGADDYITKPFAVEELVARLRALLRRHHDRAVVLRFGQRTLDCASRVVNGASGETPLTERETELLALLIRRPTQVFTRDDLLRLVFTGADSPIVVDTYVHQLRRKLGRDIVRTVRGVGYRLGTS